MVSRRKFVLHTALGAGALMVGSFHKLFAFEKPRLRISLAEWSLHRTIRSGKLDHLDFAAKSKSLGIDAVEYVNGLFRHENHGF